MAEEPEFDDWQAEAENIPEEALNNITEPTPETNQLSHPQQEVIQEKLKPVDPKKVLQEKIGRYKQIDVDNYEEYFEGVRKQSSNLQVKISNVILKNDKQFGLFGRSVAKKLMDQAESENSDILDQNNLMAFIDETLFLLYNQLDSKNLYNTKDKLIIAKGERKKEQKQEKKKQQAEERRKREQKALDQKNAAQKKPQNKVQDDMFGGATLITSKQVEDERKNKQQKPAVLSQKQESDDDDFM